MTFVNFAAVMNHSHSPTKRCKMLLLLTVTNVYSKRGLHVEPVDSVDDRRRSGDKNKAQSVVLSAQPNKQPLPWPAADSVPAKSVSGDRRDPDRRHWHPR